MTAESGGFSYKEYAKTCDPKDFWGQVKRTIAGRPVGQDQIDMIVHAVKLGLDLGPDDVLLDLGCGNGALTTYFFQACRGGLGIDHSEFLIDVAKKNFLFHCGEAFEVADVVEYVEREPDPDRFTKALCYGSLPYLTHDAAEILLSMLARRFSSVCRLFVGNLPDKAKLAVFYHPADYREGMEDDPATPIGIWRTVDEFVELAHKAGWKAHIATMPRSFHAAHYRYDAVLTRR